MPIGIVFTNRYFLTFIRFLFDPKNLTSQEITHACAPIMRKIEYITSLKIMQYGPAKQAVLSRPPGVVLAVVTVPPGVVLAADMSIIAAPLEVKKED